VFERLRWLLWNADSRRPRLPWRFLTLVVVLAVLGLAVTLALTPLEGRLFVPPGAAGWRDQAVVAIGGLLAIGAQGGVIVAAVLLAGRFVDRRRSGDFGFRLDRAWWLDLGVGLAIGAVLMAGIFVVELAAGWVRVVDLFHVGREGFAFWPWVGVSLLTYTFVGLYEELLLRGYLLTNLAEGLTWFDRVSAWWAVGVAVAGTSLLFGAMHLGNPNATLASSTGIALAAVMLAAGYVLTGELAIPIGIHIAWNFVQGTVFGFPVSGTSHGVSLIVIEQQGPALITGGAFGPEAGLIGVLSSLVGIGLVAAWVRRRAGRLRIHPAVTTPELRTGGAE